MIEKDVFVVHVDSDRLEKHLRMFFNDGFKYFEGDIKNIVRVDHINASANPAYGYKFPYPIFTFTSNSDLDTAILLLHQINSGIDSHIGKDIGELELINDGADKTLLRFIVRDTHLLEIQEKILNEISPLWRINYRKHDNKTEGKDLGSSKKIIEGIGLSTIRIEKVYLPNNDKFLLRWKIAYKIIVQMDKEYKRNYNEGSNSPPNPSRDDYRDRLENKMKPSWKPSARTIQRIKKAGDAGYLK